MQVESLADQLAQVLADNAELSAGLATVFSSQWSLQVALVSNWLARGNTVPWVECDIYHCRCLQVESLTGQLEQLHADNAQLSTGLATARSLASSHQAALSSLRSEVALRNDELTQLRRDLTQVSASQATGYTV